MTVYKIGRKKIQIMLTDSEVISFFGAYEKLLTAAGDARLTMCLLLKEGISEYRNELDGELLVEIRAKENAGCVITVSSVPNTRKRGEKIPRIFEFENSDAMIKGVVRLYKSRRSHGMSSLYKTSESYRLIISARADSDFFFMNEFCLRQSDSALEAEYTKEHGRLIAAENAVEKIGRAFSKSF